MAKVSIVMGSDSDLKIMSQAAKVLSDFGIEYEMKIISAHRMPDIFVVMQSQHRKEACL